MPASTSTEVAEHTPENRSELVLVFDAQDANPNGNPLSPSNKPRIDPVTQQAIVTDVRIKRYIRDQLTEDGHGVYIANVKTEDGNAPPREYLAERVAAVDSAADIDDGFLDEFLANAVDVRYFGATLAFDTKSNEIADAISEHLPQHLTGPVQLSPARSLNAVRENQSYNSLTSVIGTGEGKEQGGFQLDDHRIVYGLFGMSGVINENNAANTNLSEADVQRLDSLWWRSIKNQANSRSKRGQHPRLYVRVEYDSGFHIGNLDRTLRLGDLSKPEEELTDVNDTALDIRPFVDRLAAASDRIDTLHVASDPVLTIEDNGTELTSKLGEYLRSELGVAVREVDIHTEMHDTFPAE